MSTKPAEFDDGEETYAVRNANGTGAFMLESREPDTKTVLKANPDYWGKGPVPARGDRDHLHADPERGDPRGSTAFGRSRPDPGRSGAGS
jgi:hypothetical protein